MHLKPTQGLWYKIVCPFNKLTFGHKNAPAHFWKIIMEVMDELYYVAVMYLDDVVLFRDDPD